MITANAMLFLKRVVAGNDLMLGPLADNGGLTPTHLPLPGSRVIDNGFDDSCAAFDQRGLARPIDGDGDEVARCDIGAVEVTTLEENNVISPMVLIIK